MAKYPKYGFCLHTTINSSYNPRAVHTFADATLTINRIGTSWCEDGKFYPTPIFRIKYSSCHVTKTDVNEGLISPIQPAIYYQMTERFPYRNWYGQAVEISEALSGFKEYAKEAVAIVDKIDKVIAEYNLAYVHNDPLSLMIQALLKCDIRQVYQIKNDWYMNQKGIFTREDRDYALEPDDHKHAVYPWDQKESE